MQQLNDELRRWARSIWSLALALACLISSGLAFSQTPILVQHYYTGANSAPRGLTANSYTFRLPNQVLSGNALVMFVDFPSRNAILSVTDDASNVWPSAAVTVNAGMGSSKTSVYVLPNAIAGARTITVTFDAAIASTHAVFLEYYNVARTNPVGATTSSTIAVSPVIQAPSFRPASGSLVLNYVLDNVGTVGGQAANNVSAWAAGSAQSAGVAFTALGGDINNTQDTSPHFMQSAVANGGLITPTAAATQTVNDRFTTVALELKGAVAGTRPAEGIRIIKQQFFTRTNLVVPGTWTQFFPAQGNLLVGTNIYPNLSRYPFSDSNGNAWALAHNSANSPMIHYAQNPNVDSRLTVTFPLSRDSSNTTITLYDITGAATSSVLAQAVTTDPVDVSNLTVINNQPAITPRHPNGLVIATAALGQGPANGIAPGAPASAFFMPVTYPGKTDLDTFNNADAYGHSYYGLDLTQQSWNWQLTPMPNNSISSAAAEFMSAGTLSQIGSLDAAPPVPSTDTGSANLDASGGGGGGGGGCTMATDGSTEPLLPLLALIAFAAIWRRRFSRRATPQT